MIQGIFYARFFQQEGIKIVAQSPPGCIVPVEGVSKPPLFDFGVLQEYIIPRKAFFNRYVTVTDPDGKYAVLGLPVAIAHRKYHRNEFIFNFGLVVEADVDQIPYERVVRRLAATFAEMERQNEYLSQGGGGGGGDGGGGGNISRRPIESLLEIVKEDLNNYGECMIPVDEANTINMKLFPHYPPPPEVKGWHVPVAKMKLADVVDATWDLTLQKVIAHIDGVSDVRRIAFLADVSLGLAQLALRHLLYYDTILLLDMFFFGACYAPRPAIHEFVANLGGVVDECAGYVCIHGASVLDPLAGASSESSEHNQRQQQQQQHYQHQRQHQHQSQHQGQPDQGDGRPQARRGSGLEQPFHPSASTATTTTSHGTAPRRPVSNYQLIKLMTTFCIGKSVMEWLRGHHEAGFDVLRYVDVRRLVQFGVLKGYLYRVHKYVISKQYLAALATGQARPLPPSSSDDANGAGGDPLQRYTDGCHCFDQIITEQNLTDGEIMERLKTLRVAPGDLTVFYR